MMMVCVAITSLSHMAVSVRVVDAPMLPFALVPLMVNVPPKGSPLLGCTWTSLEKTFTVLPSSGSADPLTLPAAARLTFASPPTIWNVTVVKHTGPATGGAGDGSIGETVGGG